MEVLDIIIFIEMIIFNIIIIGILHYYYKLNTKYKHQIYSNTLFYTTLSWYWLSIALTISKLDNVFLQYNLNEYIVEEAIFTISYILYLIFYNYSNQKVINRIFRVPEYRKHQLKIANKLFSLLIIILILSATIASILTNKSSDRINSFKAFQYVFIIISQLSIFAFRYYSKTLKQERIYTRSKLTKARLFQFRELQKYQIFISTSILVFAIVLLLIDLKFYQLIELIFFTIIQLLMIRSIVLLNMTFNLTDEVREKFGLKIN